MKCEYIEESETCSCGHPYSDHRDEDECTVCYSEKEPEEQDGSLYAKDNKLGI